MKTITTTNFMGEKIDLDKNLFREKIDLDKNLFRQKTSSMLIAGAIGDALGVPIEMKTKEYIEKNYGRVNDFLDSGLNIFFNKGGLTKGKTGLVSDDTILSFSGVESIINKGNIDFDDIMQTSAKDYKSFPYGFGYGTTSAIKRYELLKELKTLTNPYINLGEKTSAGNGVMMKQSPYAAYFLAKKTKQEIINTNIEILTRLTHNHPTAVVASQIHNQFLMELLKTEKEIDFERLLKYLIDFAISRENDLEEEFLSQDADKISDLLKKLLEDKQNGGLKTFDEILKKYGWGNQKVYASGYVLTTMGIIYSIFLNKQNFEGLLDSINIGGDVDTFGAIIGNMIGTYKGKFYDKYYENGIKKIDELKEKINLFLDTILKSNSKKDITKEEYEEQVKLHLKEKNILKDEFYKKIKEIVSSEENIFYNSKGNPNAFKANIPHLSFAESKKLGKTGNGYFIASQEFFLADFEGHIIKKVKIGEKIKFIKLEVLK